MAALPYRLVWSWEAAHSTRGLGIHEAGPTQVQALVCKRHWAGNFSSLGLGLLVCGWEEQFLTRL